MFLAPDGDEIEIIDAAAGFLADVMPISRLHESGSADMNGTLRRQMGEMGWFALALEENKGGSGLTAVEHALFFREIGRLCGSLDVLSQALAVHVADGDLRARLISGDVGVALAVRDGGEFRLLGAPGAALALEVNETGAWLRDVSALAAETRSSLDPATSMRVSTAMPDAVLGQVDGPEVMQLARLGSAAMLIGLAEAALDLIVDYAKVRETFGRKIGAYQAVRHACADMALRAEAARCQLWFSAAAIKEGRGDAAIHLDAAKHLANQAAIANADANIQLHGGIGVTDEHDAHLLLKHAWFLAKVFGTKRALLGRLLDARVED
ncbi:acyl-CoA dehydrogenase family protein [Sphingomonas sp. BIUV-7]|uniref:Acyl-CoA dehydrogenase family protein n=1 Tax=Sphingomonas natans TaxID=3063330 RepID=A0ABT8Y860_9SPHN|nr:acyl-CoA dehydrogenase family protein [Sphingomonas sp. BIUV-7]MDO6414517.1 acyl-CoA dehydrogenase family protein [Sphingomonas sp. BIUV-7]